MIDMLAIPPSNQLHQEIIPEKLLNKILVKV
jgi:hypothetical protein